MKWRLQEGEGEAIYEIGVEDNGMFVGLTREELDSSLSTLNVMASKLGAHTTLLRRHLVENIINGPSRQVAEVLVRRVPDDQQVSKVLWLPVTCTSELQASKLDRMPIYKSEDWRDLILSLKAHVLVSL